ncbi:MAG: hypothetical protein ACP5N1_05265 [Candidatus Woesearchaeota archaeon]
MAENKDDLEYQVLCVYQLEEYNKKSPEPKCRTCSYDPLNHEKCKYYKSTNKILTDIRNNEKLYFITDDLE